MKYFEEFLKILKSFINSITDTSYVYLAGTSAVVAALLALITIVFSQYNERLIHKSNEILKEVDEMIKSIDLHGDYGKVISKINDIIYLHANQHVYKMTLSFFFLISYFSGLLWVITGIGYTNNLLKGDAGDIIIVVSSTIIIASVFFVLPIILLKFNKKTALTVKNHNQVPIEELIGYLTIKKISEENIIKNFVGPTLTLKLNQFGSLFITAKQNIPVIGVIYIYEFIGEDGLRQYIKINSSGLINNFTVKSKKKVEDNFEGLYELIVNSNYKRLYVYSEKRKEIIGTHNLLLNELQFGVSIYINENIKFSASDWVKKVLVSTKMVHHISGENNYDYKIKKM